MTNPPPAAHAADPTMSPNLRSWLASANDPATDFPLQSLPLCTFLGEQGRPSIGVGVGDRVVDVDMLMHAGALGQDEAAEQLHHAVHGGVTNFVLRDRALRRTLRERVQAFMLDGHVGQQQKRLREKALRPMSETHFNPPCVIRNYTDFYASIHHATNVGSMFRPDNPLLPNYKHVPIGYHGRASSVIPSGQHVKRPRGQIKPDDASAPVFGPCKRLDYELEVGCIIGEGNNLGEPIAIDKAGDHIAGLCLVNDWSARDMQAWEYQPLGPFLAKNFATTVSPFIVPIEALEPWRVPGPTRGDGDPQPLEYLRTGAPWSFDIELEVQLLTAQMREKNLPPHTLSRTNFKDMYWTFAQMIAHHTSNGCNLMSGDLLASGTVSGPTPGSRGCMLELSWAGNGPDGKPLPRRGVELPTGEKRVFLEDGDEVIMRAWCEKPGLRRVGFGECRGKVVG